MTESVNEYTDGMVENLQRAKEGIEMLLDMQDRVACHTITKLVELLLRKRHAQVSVVQES